MAKAISDQEKLQKELDRLKKRVQGLNEAISLQANKIGNTNILIVISREEKILHDQINRKKTALKNIQLLKRKLMEARSN